jgi:hypothetical protein
MVLFNWYFKVVVTQLHAWCVSSMVLLEYKPAQMLHEHVHNKMCSTLTTSTSHTMLAGHCAQMPVVRVSHCR